MRDKLAERLLAKVMKWTRGDVSSERGDLQAVARYRYDEYQQFSPGMKFIESLALWLNQFEKDEDRKLAYEFAKKNLIFISSSEMTHLVSITYPDIIRPILMKKIAQTKTVPEWHLKDILSSTDFKRLQRQSLFLGLSDGSHTDIFRRRNTELSNEQILRTHEIADNRASSIIKDLKKDLEGIIGREANADEAKVKMVFLLDDFSGSGISYLRKGAGSKAFEGKLAKFYEELTSGSEFAQLMDVSNLTVYLVLYIATYQAKDRLEKLGKELFDKIPFEVLVTHLLDNSHRLDCTSDPSILKLLNEHYDESIQTEHYIKGKHDKPYLGFDECGLPLILFHNTPNNSLPLLWFEDQRKFRGLFPRVSRHV
jgi:hypothetical protein